MSSSSSSDASAAGAALTGSCDGSANVWSTPTAANMWMASSILPISWPKAELKSFELSPDSAACASDLWLVAYPSVLPDVTSPWSLLCPGSSATAAGGQCASLLGRPQLALLRSHPSLERETGSSFISSAGSSSLSSSRSSFLGVSGSICRLAPSSACLKKRFRHQEGADLQRRVNPPAPKKLQPASLLFRDSGCHCSQFSTSVLPRNSHQPRS
mmetsp:Transcript_22274/g.41463  ORF Transcript_22274/g.41463 Transcript_22274/m.41463 type:complete len:214 (+) Transcript_22274:349-990(+)